MHWDGHEVAVVTTMGGAMFLAHRTMPKGWVRGMIHRQPVVAMSLAWGLAGLCIPLVLPRLRSVMKLPSNQYDAENPNVVLPKYG